MVAVAASVDCAVCKDALSFHLSRRSLTPMNGYIFRRDVKDMPNHDRSTVEYIRYLGYPKTGGQVSGVIQKDSEGNILFYGTGHEAAKYFNVGRASDVFRGIREGKSKFINCTIIPYPMGSQTH